MNINNNIKKRGPYKKKEKGQETLVRDYASQTDEIKEKLPDNCFFNVEKQKDKVMYPTNSTHYNLILKNKKRKISEKPLSVNSISPLFLEKVKLRRMESETLERELKEACTLWLESNETDNSAITTLVNSNNNLFSKQTFFKLPNKENINSKLKNPPYDENKIERNPLIK